VTRTRFVLSLPERVVRATAALVGGAVHETAQLVLPRLVRRSRLYEATAKNLLRVAIELVGGVEGAPTAETSAGVGELAVRKGAGNVVELGSIAAFGFSPLWLLAGASDLLRGSRVYLAALVAELKRADLLADDVEVGSVDELLGVLERGTGGTARLIDVPPLELGELRRSLAELRDEGDSLPSQAELAALYEGLRRTAKAEERTLLEVSAGVGLASCLRGSFRASIWSCRTARIGGPCGARASARTPGESPDRTAVPSPATSTPSGRPGRSGCSAAPRVTDEALLRLNPVKQLLT